MNIPFNKHLVRVDNTHFTVFDNTDSKAPVIIQSEMNNDEYRLNQITFEPGDVVIDIGANIGFVSFYLALKYPFITIHAIEPMSENCKKLKVGIAYNQITNIILHEMGLSDKISTSEIIWNASNSGVNIVTGKQIGRAHV